MLVKFPLAGLSPRARHFLAAAMFAASLVALACFGVLGLTLGPSNQDFGILYFGGRGWLAGQDPYPTAIRLTPLHNPVLFPYPPQSAFLLVPLALLDLKAATVVWLLLNLASIAGIVLLTVRRVRESAAPPPTSAELLVVAALIIGNSFTTKTVWQGQTSLIVLAAIMLAWELIPRRWLAAGICLAVAGFKPQCAVLFGIWLLLDRQWRVLASATVATILMSAYPFLTQGVLESMSSWWTVLQAYGEEGPNAPGFRYIVTLQSLLHAVGIPAPNLSVVGVILTVVLWLFRNRISRDAVPGILLGLSITLIAGHDQDCVWLIPLATTLWLRARTDPYRAVVLGSLLILIMFPLRVLRVFQLEPLYPWRTVLILVLTGLAIQWTWHRTPRDGAVRGTVAPA